MDSYRDLVTIVDRALADAATRSGGWLACRPGCSQCCHGVFAISALDAARLHEGLAQLEQHDRGRADAVRARALAAVEHMTPTYPGDPVTGQLSTAPEMLEAFDDFANEEPCPALDPATQTCDLYAARPMLCRTFGPPLRTPNDDLAVCELCFDGAPPEEIERCQMDPEILDAELQAEHLFAKSQPGAAQETSETRQTIVAFALVR